MVWCGVVWCGGARRSAVRCSVVWCRAVRCSVPKAVLPKGNGRDVLHTQRFKTGGLCVYVAEGRLPLRRRAAAIQDCPGAALPLWLMVLLEFSLGLARLRGMAVPQKARDHGLGGAGEVSCHAGGRYV